MRHKRENEPAARLQSCHEGSGLEHFVGMEFKGIYFSGDVQSDSSQLNKRHCPRTVLVHIPKDWNMHRDDVVAEETGTMALGQPLGVTSITHSQLTD